MSKLIYKCGSCDRYFKREDNLNAHLLFDHTTLMPSCSRKNTNIDSLKDYIMNCINLHRGKKCRYAHRMIICQNKVNDLKRYKESILVEIEKIETKSSNKNYKEKIKEVNNKLGCVETELYFGYRNLHRAKSDLKTLRSNNYDLWLAVKLGVRLKEAPDMDMYIDNRYIRKLQDKFGITDMSLKNLGII